MVLTRLPSSSFSSTALQKHACTSKPLFRGAGCWKKRERLLGFQDIVAVKPPCAAAGKGGIVPAGDDDDGVSLGTVRLPGNIDIARFESLLFQVSVPASEGNKRQCIEAIEWCFDMAETLKLIVL